MILLRSKMSVPLLLVKDVNRETRTHAALRELSKLYDSTFAG